MSVGSIHSEFTARLAYVLTNLGLVESHIVELRRASKLERARFLLRHRGPKKYEIDAEALLDPSIMEIEDKLAEEEARMKILEAVAAGYQKIQEGASREISRRENERTSRGD